MKNVLSGALLILLLCLSNITLADNLKVVFINPGHPEGDNTGAFWSVVNRFMQASANDLNIELITLFAERNHLRMKELAITVPTYQPDYVVLVNEKGVGPDLVRTISRHGIPIFMLLNRFTKEEQTLFSEAQQWLLVGSLIPDNFTAGKKLLADLLAKHRQNTPGIDKLNLIALQGDYRSAASTERTRGMEAFLSSTQQLSLLDSPVANWSEIEAYRKIKGLLVRHRIDIIWAANDSIATGARKAVKEASLKYKVSIGGINWDKTSDDFPIDVTYGGHVTLGAKALVMLADFHAKKMLPCEMHRQMDIFRSSRQYDIKAFHRNIKKDQIEQFDFSRFSKSNPETAIFSMETFVTGQYQLQVAKSTGSSEFACGD